jgi:hypothetical protein
MICSGQENKYQIPFEELGLIGMRKLIVKILGDGILPQFVRIDMALLLFTKIEFVHLCGPLKMLMVLLLSPHILMLQYVNS